MTPASGRRLTATSEAVPPVESDEVLAAKDSLHWSALLAEDVAEVEHILSETLQSRYPRVANVLAHVQHYRGKRLRPSLLLLTAKACGAIVPAHHVLGAVVEMIHTATLIHDDVLDNAELRRHVRTVNSKWGTRTSVLLGDHLFTRAFHLTSTLGDARACEMIGEATNRTCEGELRQNLEIGNLDLDEKEYFDVIEGKTADLIACCCRLGAYYAGADEEIVEALRRFGRHLGIAFQIVDDLLDLVGDEKTTGKSLGTDLEQQKLTLPLLWLLNRSGPDLARQARIILRSDGNHKRAALLPLLGQSSAVDHARRTAQRHVESAQQELHVLQPTKWRAILGQLTEQVIQRDH